MKDTKPNLGDLGKISQRVHLNSDMRGEGVRHRWKQGGGLGRRN